MSSGTRTKPDRRPARSRPQDDPGYRFVGPHHFHQTIAQQARHGARTVETALLAARAPPACSIPRAQERPEQECAGRDASGQQQPQGQKCGGVQRIGQASAHSPPRRPAEVAQDAARCSRPAHAVTRPSPACSRITGPAPHRQRQAEREQQSRPARSRPSRRAAPWRAGEAQKASMPARVMATTVARPDRTRAASSAQVGDRTRRRQHDRAAGASMANLARKPESGGSPASSSAQPMKLMPRTAMVAGNGDADLLARSRLVILLALAERLPRHGQHVRSDLAAALDQFDQEEESGDRQDGTGQIEQRAARHRDLARADRRQQRAGGDQHACTRQPRHVLRRQHRHEPKAMVSSPPTSNASRRRTRPKLPASPPNISSHSRSTA